MVRLIELNDVKLTNDFLIPQLTLSGLLNFIDGLWSSCGDERIIVFTTNYKDKLDPALLRPGRMDMHIHMSYCTPHGFRILASNYLGIDRDYSQTHFKEIESLIESCQVTPAEIAEELMRSEDAIHALEGVLKLLKKKVAEAVPEVKDDDIPSPSSTPEEENETETGEELSNPVPEVPESKSLRTDFVLRRGLKTACRKRGGRGRVVGGSYRGGRFVPVF